MPTERILYNGHVTTLNPRQPQVSALRLSAGRIEAAGTDDEILAQAGPDAERIELNGRRVIPGHHHPVMGADGRVWLTGCGCGV